MEKRAREILSSSNSSPERSVVVNSEVVEVVEMPENLESKVDLVLARLETMDKKLENIIPQCQTWRVNSTNWKIEL